MTRVPNRAFIAEFEKRISHHAALVVERRAYIDTVSVLLPRRLLRTGAQALCRLLGKQFRSCKSACWTHPYRVTIHQPSADALRFVERIEPDHIVSRCDIALDCVTETTEDAHTLREFLAFHAVMPWRGSRTRNEQRHVIYYSPPQTGRNIALYADRPSKVGGRPACHIELRLDRARSCRRHAIHRVTDMMALDSCAVMRRNIRLGTLLPHRLETLLNRIVAEQMRKCGRYDRETTYNLIWNYIARAHLQDEKFWPGSNWSETVPVQVFVDRVRPVAARLKSRIDLRSAVLSINANAFFALTGLW